MTAFNRAVGLTKAANPAYPSTPSYVRHPDHWRRVEPQRERVLREWAEKCGHDPATLERLFGSEKDRLEAAPPEDLVASIDGKLLLNAFLARVATAVGRQVDRGLWLSIYLDKCPDPPAEITGLVAALLADAASHQW